METITMNLTTVWECQHCALSLTHITRSGSKLIREFLKSEGKKPQKTIRDLVSINGCYNFFHGCGYSILDDDVLGGNGSGRTERKFREYVQETTGKYLNINWDSENTRQIVCKDCRADLAAY